MNVAALELCGEGFQAFVLPVKQQQQVDGVAGMVEFLDDRRCLLETALHVNAVNGRGDGGGGGAHN